METIEILEKLVAMFRISDPDLPGKQIEVPAASVLLEPLPEEAKMKPKAGAKGFDANLVGYKGIYIIKTAIERLGPDGWISVPVWGKIYDCTLPSGKDGYGIEAEMVTYFPGLHRGTVTAADGKGEDLGDAKKAACTTALKRAMMEIGIGWDGYTEHTGHMNPVDVDMQGPGPQAPAAPKQASAPAAPRGTGTAGGTAAGSPAKPQASPNKPISEAQTKMIQKMFGEKGVSPEAWFAWSGGRKLADFNAAEASAIIQSLIDGTHDLIGGGAPSDDPYGGAQ